jgi:hypothetical protein
LFPVGEVDRLMRLSNQLLQDQAMRERLIEAARNYVLHEHDAQKMVDRHANYYRWMLKS